MDSSTIYSTDIEIKKENYDKCIGKDILEKQRSTSLGAMELSNDDFDLENLSPGDEMFCGNLSTIDEMIDKDKENCAKISFGRRETLNLSTIMEEMPKLELENCPSRNGNENTRFERDLEMSFLNNEVQVCKAVLKDDELMVEKLLRVCKENSDIFSDTDIDSIKNGDLSAFVSLIQDFRDMKNTLEVVRIRMELEKRIDEL